MIVTSQRVVVLMKSKMKKTRRVVHTLSLTNFFSMHNRIINLATSILFITRFYFQTNATLINMQIPTF